MSDILSLATPEIESRFWSKVDQSGGVDACWPYMGGRKSAGYGNFFIKRETPGRSGKLIFVNAHKFAYTITHAEVCDALVVRHTCDNPPCCNPKHLLIGTHKDNMQDAIERGRIDYAAISQTGIVRMRETKKRQRRFTEQDIATIIVTRAQGMSLPRIAALLGVKHVGFSSFSAERGYKDIPLVQQLTKLSQQGIHFPYPRTARPLTPLHPNLQTLVEKAALILTECASYALDTTTKVSYEHATAEINELF